MASATTGYGRQTEEIVGRMIKAGWEVYSIGGIGGQTVWGGKITHHSRLGVKIPVLPTFGQLGGEDVAQTYINKYKLDFVITLWDSFVVHYLGKLSVPGMMYLPIDAPFTDNMYVNSRDAYRLIPFSEYGRQELLKWYPPSKVTLIPHGIDTELYHPISENERSKMRDELEIPEDAFMIVNCGANMGERKQLPFQMIVFAEFLKTHPDAYLYLFSNMLMGYPHGYDLRTWANMLGIKDHIRYPDFDPIIEPWTAEKMVNLYGASDLFWSMTLGEGFGLPTLEAMACQIAPIITNCSTSPELVGGCGWLIDTIPALDFTFIPVWIPTLQRYPVPNGRSALACLNDAYRHPDKVKEYGKKARERALNYDWEKFVMPKWFKLLKETEEDLALLNELKAPSSV